LSLASAIYRGRVHHARYLPHPHAFSYSIAQWWLALDELEQVAAQSRWFSLTNRWAPLRFKRSDYLPDTDGDLAAAVRQKLSEQLQQPISGRVFFLGALRTCGLYFNPLNCYFVQSDGAQEFSYMLAEVSNTPWNERHYYAVDLQQPLRHPKTFFVSPFNPLNMHYRWQLKPPAGYAAEAGDKALIHLDVLKQQATAGTDAASWVRHFSATMKLSRVALNRRSIRNVLLRYPINTVGTVAAIYWQALRLWLKRNPVYISERTCSETTSSETTSSETTSSAATSTESKQNELNK